MVFSTASGKNQEMLRVMGAVPIDYQKEDFAGVIRKKAGKLDAIFDPVGGSYLKRSLKLLKKGGSYENYGFHADISKGFPALLKLMAKFFFYKLTNPSKNMEVFQLRDNEPRVYMTELDELFELYLQEKIDPVVSELFPLERAAEAHRALEQGKRQGKILIACNAG